MLKGPALFTGGMVALCIAGDKCQPLQRVDSDAAVAGQGLTGDRYASQRGSHSRKRGPDREVTLIENEAIEARARECKITITPEHARRAAGADRSRRRDPHRRCHPNGLCCLILVFLIRCFGHTRPHLMEGNSITSIHEYVYV